MAVVPGHELGRRPRARKILARDAETTIGLRTDGVDHRVVQLEQLLVRHVPSDLDVSEEAEAGTGGDLLERP